MERPIKKDEAGKMVYMSVFENGELKLKRPVRSVEMVVGVSQLVDENTSITLSVE